MEKKFNLKNKDIALIHVSPLPYSGNYRFYAIIGHF